MTDALPHVLVNLHDPRIDPGFVSDVLASISLDDDAPPRFGAIRVLLPRVAADRHRAALRAEWIVEEDPDLMAATNRSWSAAAHHDAELLVVDGATVPDARSLQELEAALSRDPYWAFAEPRLSSFGTRLVEKLDPRLGDPGLGSIPAGVIESAPPLQLVPDHIGPAVLISRRIVRDFGPLDVHLETLRGMLREAMARARRVGFRCIVSNRALTRATRLHADWSAAWERDLERVRDRHPEVRSLEVEWAQLALHEYESKLGRATSYSDEIRKTLLIDLTDLGTIRNGTAESVLGLLGGMHANRRDWQIELLVSPEVAAFHGVARRLPELPCVWPEPAHRYTAVFRPVQPWSMAGQARLHHLGLFNFYLMHDTISHDIFFESVFGLEQNWRFAASTADGIVYNSAFTRQRFRARFAPDANVDELVCHHSLDPADYHDKAVSSDAASHIAVVGNAYPHKAMQRTVTDLAAAFPHQKLKALGYEDASIAQLEGLPSGQLPDAEVDALYAHAKLVVYPSYYEGFGLPILRGLACGKPVVARRSALNAELAAHYCGPGQLYEFETTTELVETVGRLLHGHELSGLAFGSALRDDASPRSWSDAARDVLEFIENRVRKPESSNWARRQERIDAMLSYAAVQAHWGA